jgi:hypothetical protein
VAAELGARTGVGDRGDDAAVGEVGRRVQRRAADEVDDDVEPVGAISRAAGTRPSP